MNKLILKEAIKSGFSINGNYITYQEHSIALITFLIEMNKLHFTNTIQSSIEKLKEQILKNDKQIKEFMNG